MTSVEKVLNVLKERHIAVSRMERDLGFSNGYIRQLKKGTMPIERLASVASYLDMSINDLMSDGNVPLLEMKEAATPKDDGLSDKELLLLSIFNSLPEDRQWAILRQAQAEAQNQPNPVGHPKAE